MSMWGSDCDAIRLKLALMAGHDLPRSEETEVERHLAKCADCRRHWADLGQSQHLLEQARLLSSNAANSGSGEKSVWSGVSRELDRLDQQRSERRRNWRRLLPAGAVAAACLTVGMVMGDLWFAASVPEMEGGRSPGGRFAGQALVSPSGASSNLRVSNVAQPSHRPNGEWAGRERAVDPWLPRTSGPYRNY